LTTFSFEVILPRKTKFGLLKFEIHFFLMSSDGQIANTKVKKSQEVEVMRGGPVITAFLVLLVWKTSGAVF
jgi:hypothetical protein